MCNYPTIQALPISANKQVIASRTHCKWCKEELGTGGNRIYSCCVPSHTGDVAALACQYFCSSMCASKAFYYAAHFGALPYGRSMNRDFRVAAHSGQWDQRQSWMDFNRLWGGAMEWRDSAAPGCK